MPHVAGAGLHRRACHLAAYWLSQLPDAPVAGWEIAFGAGVADALSANTKSNSRRRRRVNVVEVKVNRSDLLADLRAGKMQRAYQAWASHCYLAATPACFLTTWRDYLLDPVTFRSDVTAQLRAKGLPSSWGVLMLPELPHQWCSPVVLNPARRMQEIGSEFQLEVISKIARSHMHRILSPDSPLVELPGKWPPPDLGIGAGQLTAPASLFSERRK